MSHLAEVPLVRGPTYREYTVYKVLKSKVEIR